MNYYKVNSTKRKRALRSYMRKHIVKDKMLVKICYVLTGILRIFAIITGVIVIMNTIIITKELIDLFYLLITSFIPWMLSLIPYVVCIVNVGKKYRLRLRESIKLEDDCIRYCFKDDRENELDMSYAYIIKYNEINNYVFDKKTKEIEISGNILVERYEDGIMFDTIMINKIGFLDTYDISIVDMIKKYIN